MVGDFPRIAYLWWDSWSRLQAGYVLYIPCSWLSFASRRSSKFCASSWSIRCLKRVAITRTTLKENFRPTAMKKNEHNSLSVFWALTDIRSQRWAAVSVSCPRILQESYRFLSTKTNLSLETNPCVYQVRVIRRPACHYTSLGLFSGLLPPLFAFWFRR